MCTDNDSAFIYFSSDNKIYCVKFAGNIHKCVIYDNIASQSGPLPYNVGLNERCGENSKVLYFNDANLLCFSEYICKIIKKVAFENTAKNIIKSELILVLPEWLINISYMRILFSIERFFRKITVIPEIVFLLSEYHQYEVNELKNNIKLNNLELILDKIEVNDIGEVNISLNSMVCDFGDQDSKYDMVSMSQSIMKKPETYCRKININKRTYLMVNDQTYAMNENINALVKKVNYIKIFDHFKNFKIIYEVFVQNYNSSDVNISFNGEKSCLRIIEPRGMDVVLPLKINENRFQGVEIYEKI